MMAAVATLSCTAAPLRQYGNRATHPKDHVYSCAQVMNICVNPSTIVKFVQTSCNNHEIALRIASTAGLGGADELFTGKFQGLLNEMNIPEVFCLSIARLVA